MHVYQILETLNAAIGTGVQLSDIEILYYLFLNNIYNPQCIICTF